MIKHRFQQTEYTCGPACMVMVLEALGIESSEKQLTAMMKPSKVSGTTNKAFSEVAEYYKLNYTVKRNSSLSDLRSLYAENIIVVCYTPDNYGHFAIIKNITQRRISLIDPYYGSDVTYNTREFLQRWKGYEEKRWLFALEIVKDKNKAGDCFVF